MADPRVYCVLGTYAMPSLLTSRPQEDDSSALSFLHRFSPSMPPLIAIFTSGAWPKDGTARCFVDFGSAAPPLELGHIDSDHRALARDIHLSDAQQAACQQLQEQDLYCKLCIDLTAADEDTSHKATAKTTSASPVAAPATGKTSQATPVAEPVSIPAFTEETPLGRPTKARLSRDKTAKRSSSAKRQPIISSDASQAPKRASRTSEAGQASSKTSRAGSSGGIPSQMSKTVQRIVFESVTAAGETPSGRWGHTMTAMCDNLALMFGGQGDGLELCKDGCWLYAADKRSWTNLSSSAPASRMGHAACYDPVKKAVYVTGGAKYTRFFRDLQIFDLESRDWKALKIDGERGPARSYHSCTLYERTLVLFGGNYPNPDPQPDGCSNDVFVFDLELKTWCRPALGGDLPLPRSGHSATVVGRQLIIFGGWDAPTVYNDVYALDLLLMEFKRLTPSGTPPPPRSWHLAIPMTVGGHSCILVHGGYDGDQALNDVYLLDLDDMEWRPYEHSIFASPRAGHTAAILDGQAHVFGGGDNEGRFFNSFDVLPLDAEV